MSTNFQIDAYLRPRVPNFIGVYPADKLPSLNRVPPNSCLVANMSGRNEQGTHWIALMHLMDPHEPPIGFDSYALLDQLNSIVGTHADFHDYLKKASQLAGHNGVYHVNRQELQCVVDTHGHPSDVCGEYACYACLKQTLPQDPNTGAITPEWRQHNIVGLSSTCQNSDHIVRQLVQLR